MNRLQQDILRHRLVMFLAIAKCKKESKRPLDLKQESAIKMEQAVHKYFGNPKPSPEVTSTIVKVNLAIEIANILIPFLGVHCERRKGAFAI